MKWYNDMVLMMEDSLQCFFSSSCTQIDSIGRIKYADYFRNNKDILLVAAMMEQLARYYIPSIIGKS
jgi:hypothetical protein